MTAPPSPRPTALPRQGPPIPCLFCASAHAGALTSHSFLRPGSSPTACRKASLTTPDAAALSCPTTGS